MAIGPQVLDEINRQIESGQLFLPSLPEGLPRIRAVLNDPDAGSRQISAALAGDPGLATRILKVANSSLHRGNNEVQSLQQAVNRLGNRLLNTLVNSYHLMQMICHSTSGRSDYIRYLHQHSLRVAAYSYAVARHVPAMDPDDALLAGLVHDIGYLPLLGFLSAADNLSPAQQLQALRGLKTGLTERLLQSWRFPASTITAAREHEHYQRTVSQPDLADVVTIADLNALRDESGNVAALDWGQIGAFTRTGIDPHVPLQAQPRLEPDLHKARTLLGL